MVFAAVMCVCRVQSALGNSYCTLSASIMLHHLQQIVFYCNYIAKKYPETFEGVFFPLYLA